MNGLMRVILSGCVVVLMLAGASVQAADTNIMILPDTAGLTVSRDAPYSAGTDAYGPAHHRIGIFRPSTQTFYLDTSGDGIWSGPSTDARYTFGITGDLPVQGDWDMNGPGNIGIYRPSTHLFYLDYNGNGAWDGAVTDRRYDFGTTGDIPVTGDWYGVSHYRIGIFRPSTHTFYLDRNDDGAWNGVPTDTRCDFGLSTDIPVAGRWNPDGTNHSVGIWRPSAHSFYLDYNGNCRWDGAAIDRRYDFGITGDVPAVGDWNSDYVTELGIFRPSTHTFYLDTSGNNKWDGAVVDTKFVFGVNTDTPLPGRWGPLPSPGD
jgi:hypothetical protein